MSTYKVLIADDEPYISRVLRLVLQQAGYEVTCVNNGKEALDAYEVFRPDILVTDVRMPQMSGKLLVESIRGSNDDRNIPVIVMTSTLESENREWVGEICNVSFIGKPVSPRDLVRIVNNQLANDAPA